MESKPYKFGLILPSYENANYAKEKAAKFGIDLHVSYTALEEAIPVAKKMEADGIEVILSGEGTSSLLRKTIQIPIVGFSRNSIDFIKGLKAATHFGKNILVPIYKTFFREIKLLEAPFNVKITQITYDSLAELRSILNGASKKGYDVIIGTGPSILIAQKLGLNTVETGRSNEDINVAFNTAISVVKSKRKEQEKSERYRCIIEAASDGIITTDKNGLITTANQTATQILGCDNQDITGKSIKRFMSATAISKVYTKFKPIYDSLEKVNRKTVVCNHHPFMVKGVIAGCVSTLNEVSNVIRAENKIRRSLLKGHSARYVISDFLYESSKMKEVVSKVIQFAKTESSLLISGETGTGKEILSQSIHNLGRRKLKPFVSLNCAALPDQLLESELFGYEEGAFTGSRKGGKPGLFELAHNGTIFLDEIGETAENVQIRLLRVLQEREIMRLGADQLVPINVRVIAASNKNLAQEVQRGNFREDLFFRLNVLHVHIPPVRDRLDDIPVLIQSFIKYFAKEHNLKPLDFPSSCLEKLKTYSWPGNVRQIRNFTERIVLMSQSGFQATIFDEIFTDLNQYNTKKQSVDEKQNLPVLNDPIQRVKNEYDIEQIKKALLETGYSKSKAARKLGISRTTLWKRLKKANLAE